MKNIILTLTLLIFLSCNQDEPTQTNDPCPIRTITTNTDGATHTDTAVYEQNKLKEIYSGSKRIAFAYNSAGRLARMEYLNTAPVYQIYFVYDSKGNLTEKTINSVTNNTPHQEYKHTYAYANGKVSELKLYSDDGTYLGKFVYYWSGDNIAKTEEVLYDGRTMCTTNFTYNNDKENTLRTKFFNYDLSDHINGTSPEKDALLLSKNELATAASGCWVRQSDTYNYTYTSKGLIREVRINAAAAHSFTYPCD